MRLNTKFTLYFTVSKLLLFGLFLLLLPIIFNWYSRYTIDRFLHTQQEMVFENIQFNGLDYYLQGDNSFGSYAMLKEDYIAIQQVDSAAAHLGPAKINVEQRVIDRDTIVYRILHRYFQVQKKSYLLEIGRSQKSIQMYASILQQVALQILVVLLILTVLIDYFYGQYLLKPLQEIIRRRLSKRTFPFVIDQEPLSTTTIDFKLLDEKLRELMEMATTAYQREKEFTANASHELVTPISIMRSKLENLLDQESISEEIREKLEGTMTTLERLHSIVRTLLFLARVEGGQYERGERVDLKQLVEDVLEELQPMMESRQISLSLALDTITLEGQHRQLLFHVVYNIVNNAIQYSHPGGAISIYQQRRLQGLSLFIRDNGIGMDNEQLNKVFNRFHVRQAHGHGLGLAIVKGIADFLQIKVAIRSEKGQGTVVELFFHTMTTPLKTPQSPSDEGESL